MKLADLKPAPYNPREIADDSLAGLAQSAESFGDLSGIVWNKRSGFLVCGHQRIRALRQRGAEFKKDAFILNEKRFPVRVVDWDEQTERAANVAANNPHIAGEWTGRLAAILEGLKADLPNFEGLNLDKLLADAPQESPEIVEDEVPEPPSDPITKPGDLWVLGRHRLLCGDCSVDKEFSRCTEGEPCSLCLTDPPYGIDVCGQSQGKGGGVAKKNEYGGGDWDKRKIENIRGVILPLAGDSIVWGGNYYASDLPDSSCWIVWDKDNGETSFADIEIAWTSFNSSSRLFRWKWRGMIQEDMSNKEARVHPTQKPVALFAWCANKFCSEGAICDPFLGSGTTLIAAEQLDRRCFGLEIEPKYCDVVVERWQNLTGEKAKREPV